MRFARHANRQPENPLWHIVATLSIFRLPIAHKYNKHKRKPAHSQPNNASHPINPFAHHFQVALKSKETLNPAFLHSACFKPILPIPKWAA
jgi:hypothetical protein